MPLTMQMTGDGNVLMLSGGILMGECCCNGNGNGSPPTECLAILATRRYRIQGYVDGLFTPCGGCPAAGAYSVWGGTLPLYSAPCRWAAGVAETNYNMGTTWFGASYNNIALVFADPMYWSLAIRCGGPSANVWVGDKATGDTPAGVYTYASGCDSSVATVTIEQY